MHWIKTQLRLYAAVFKKNLLEYIRYPANFVFSLLMPVVWTLPIYFLIRSFAPGGTSTGLMSWVGNDDFYGYFDYSQSTKGQVKDDFVCVCMPAQQGCSQSGVSAVGAKSARNITKLLACQLIDNVGDPLVAPLFYPGHLRNQSRIRKSARGNHVGFAFEQWGE